ncbi:MarR family winged helix-turn-helix transcriptional regulator [Jeotgalibacillus aurantiacus]|uniref:MarR family winged helix-turn-helix transcriptional regulator n=1 Tax=Jeotgalibacillus aurantiacus TaxID=2763266 RepID=UPI001D0A1A8B|nr:MarR family transcriptional regulator [Jeotgalibacillus aurantiacus]
MNLFEELLTSLQKTSEMSIAIMKPRDNGAVNHGLMVFLFMLYHQGEIKTSEISDHFGVTSGAATGIADKLEQLGLIERVRSKKDRRIVIATLTDQGKQLVENKKKEHVELYQEILNDFSEQEIRETIQSLNKIATKIDHYTAKQKEE